MPLKSRLKEQDLFTGPEDVLAIKRALEKLHDALGTNYTTYSEVIDELDNLRADLRPTDTTYKIANLFKTRSQDNSQAMNPPEFWHNQGKQLNSVVDVVRLYLLANALMFSGCQALKNRILILANQGRWK